MRKHRSNGYTVAALAAAGLALTRPGTSGTVLLDATATGHAGRRHTTVQLVSHVGPHAVSSRDNSSWRDVAQSVMFNPLGVVTTRVGTSTRHRSAVTARSRATLAASDAASEEASQREVAAFIAVVQANQQQQFLAALSYQQAMYELQQFTSAVTAREDTAARAAAASAPAPAPEAVTGNTAGGAWAALRNCESGGNYAENSGNGFYGAYQFSLATWRGLGEPGYPNEASPATQDAAAAQLQARSGWGQWPACSHRLGL